MIRLAAREACRTLQCDPTQIEHGVCWFLVLIFSPVVVILCWRFLASQGASRETYRMFAVWWCPLPIGAALAAFGPLFVFDVAFVAWAVLGARLAFLAKVRKEVLAPRLVARAFLATAVGLIGGLSVSVWAVRHFVH